jgi:hypothetical protein
VFELAHAQLVCVDLALGVDQFRARSVDVGSHDLRIREQALDDARKRREVVRALELLLVSADLFVEPPG